MSSNSRRVRSIGLPCDERLELVGADLDLAGDDRACRGRARLGTAPAPHDGLDARDELLGVARLGHPVVGAQAQPAHALGDGRLPGADDHAAGRAARSQTSRGTPTRCGPSIARSTTSAPGASRRALSTGTGAGEHAVLPAEPVQALAQHLDESCVAVDYGDAQRRCDDGGRVGHVGRSVGRDPSARPPERPPITGFSHAFIRKERKPPPPPPNDRLRHGRTAIHARRRRLVRWRATTRGGWTSRRCSSAVEDAPPVAAADVLGERLAEALGAREVSFLDRRLQRSGAHPARPRRQRRGHARRRDGRPRERVPLAGQPARARARRPGGRGRRRAPAGRACSRR